MKQTFKSGLLAAATLALGWGVVATAPQAAAEAARNEEVVALFERWNAALQTGDANTVAALYAPKGVLLPTVSNKVRADRAAITDYFEHFLELKPKGTIVERHVEVLDDDTAVDAGTYAFDLVRNGKHEKVNARYTFLYEKIDGSWLIMNHHSSAMPEPVR